MNGIKSNSMNFFSLFWKGCKAIGLDVSPLCIEMAKKVASEEGMEKGQCSFFELDATIDPRILLSGTEVPVFWIYFCMCM